MACQHDNKTEATFIVLKEDGKEFKVCESCAHWWKKIDPTIVLWTID